MAESSPWTGHRIFRLTNDALQRLYLAGSRERLRAKAAAFSLMRAFVAARFWWARFINGYLEKKGQ